MCENDCTGPPGTPLNSSHMYHRYNPSPALELKENPVFPVKNKYERDEFLEEARISAYKQTYTWKYGDPNTTKNPHLDSKVQFIKEFDETKLRFISRPMKPITSLSHNDYIFHPPKREDPLDSIFMPSSAKTTKIVIDGAKPGYSKYLDPSATVTKLDYVHYTPKSIRSGIGAQDAITFYTWKQTKPPRASVLHAQDLGLGDNKRRLENRNELQRVPHTGMNTEHRDNYLEPNSRELKLHMPNLENLLTYLPYEPSPVQTSTQIIRSGERTQTYL